MIPSLFLSHGSPHILLENSEARKFLTQFASEMERPKAILVASAHFETNAATVTSATAPGTIHDFRSPHKELFDIAYSAPGAPDLAHEVAGRLMDRDVSVRLDPVRGFDHGAWVPMSLAYPDADIPMLQLSLQTARGAAYHFELGEILRPLRDKGVLIIGSGSATHNLEELYSKGYAHDSEAPQWVIAFSEWVHKHVEAGDVDALTNYRERAPYAIENHPTEEHFLPLFIAAGAGAKANGRLIHASHTYGILAMDAYAFD